MLLFFASISLRIRYIEITPRSHPPYFEITAITHSLYCFVSELYIRACLILLLCAPVLEYLYVYILTLTIVKLYDFVMLAFHIPSSVCLLFSILLGIKYSFSLSLSTIHLAI